MQPTQKHYKIDNLLTSFFGVDRKKSVLANKCVSCGKDAIEFKDEISVKEFQISGLCQTCQDEVFK